MKIAFLLASIAGLATLAGCTSLQSVSVTQIPSDRSRPLQAEVSNTALLGIHFSNDFIEPLTGDLMRQCPRGRVTGILTKQESSFYVIVQTRRVVATGYCVYDAAPPEPSEATAMREAAREAR
ncbi:MAG TPA: hypothetical protein VGL81_05750 [Polyangiaceae bacterium]|jgi:hypothetical protein